MYLSCLSIYVLLYVSLPPLVYMIITGISIRGVNITKELLIGSKGSSLSSSSHYAHSPFPCGRLPIVCWLTYIHLYTYIINQALTTTTTTTSLYCTRKKESVCLSNLRTSIHFERARRSSSKQQGLYTIDLYHPLHTNMSQSFVPTTTTNSTKSVGMKQQQEQDQGFASSSPRFFSNKSIMR